MQDKFFFTNQYDNIINSLYEENILDDNEIDIMQNNKITIKVMTLKDKCSKIIGN